MKSVTYIAVMSMMGWCESLDGCAPVYSEGTGGTGSSTSGTAESGTSVPTGTAPTGTTAATGEASTDPTGEASTASTGAVSTTSTGEVSATVTGTVSTSSTGEASTASTGEASASSTGGPLPDAPVLDLMYSAIKQFNFSWGAAAGAQSYELWESETEGAPFVKIQALDINETSISLTMPLHLRFGARYVLKACNEDGCADSNEVEVKESMAEAIGYFKAAHIGDVDQFGSSVAMSGDGTTIAVGAPYEDGALNTLNASGAVNVFVLGKTWTPQTTLKALNKAVGDVFGHDVAMSADGTTIAVGAFHEDSPGTGVNHINKGDGSMDSGAVYVFVRVGDAWQHQAYIKASNTGPGDEFGDRVALSADGNTLAVGAHFEDNTNNLVKDSGAVYVFERVNNEWNPPVYIKAPNLGAEDRFGRSLAVSGDGATLAVGVPYELSDDSGAVHVFVRVDKAWEHQAYIKGSNTNEDDNFGDSVSLSTDGNILAVGASAEDSVAQDSGAVYVFKRTKDVWSEQVSLKASNLGVGDLFGRNITMSAPGNLLVVGAQEEDNPAKGVGGVDDDDIPLAGNSGAVYVFVPSGDTWSQRAYVKASNTRKGDYFGTGLAVSFDGKTLAVGAHVEDSNAVGVGGDQAKYNKTYEDLGAVYVY